MHYNPRMESVTASQADEPPLESHLARFGLASFRTGQREVIATVLAGQDCLCIMPTGGGKSLCYQLPAVARPGLTLVVSPLIALMKDQVDALQDLGIAATFINSSLAPAETYARMDAMAAGLYNLVYVAPERLRSSLFVEKLRQVKLNLLAIDEAHCISQWGHDFRPDYARLGRFRQRLGSPPTIALTATATPHVRSDILQQLQLQEPRTFITGFARPNLRFEVQHALSERISSGRCSISLQPLREPELSIAPRGRSAKNWSIRCASRSRGERLASITPAWSRKSVAACKTTS
jgi:ATP-dependent DNA helicase RecQ